MTWLRTRLAGTTLASFVVGAFACSGKLGSNDLPRGVPNGSASAGSSGGAGGGDGVQIGPTDSCRGLECQQQPCDGGGTTTVSGTVYAPEGTLPLYNVLVYVPNEPLESIGEGASCDKCGHVSGKPLVTAVTDTEGKFVLENVPAGSDIPLVIQVGKWRREVALPKVDKCVDNAISDPELTSLPSNQSEGHLPRIALTTGGADPLECLLRKIGIDAEEFTLSSGAGRVNLFAASGGSMGYKGMNNDAPFEKAQPLWSSLDTLKKYDILLMACEGNQFIDGKPDVARQAMHDYAGLGGRIFMSHWHNVWMQHGPKPWPSLANWDFQSDPPSPYEGVVDQSFPKGAALAEWLVHVNASKVLGELPISEPQHTLTTVAPTMATPWITGKQPDTGSVKYFTFNAPVGAAEDEVCGRVVFSDIHVSSGDDTGTKFPNGCKTKSLTPQEKALVFMLFDLSACLQPDDEPPVPPIH